MEEIWKVYKEFNRPWNAKNPKHYIIEVSNYGNVKCNGEIVEPYINSGGYKCCHSFKIARAVAELFIPNPENKPAVDHIDTNTQNDMVNNLRWVTNKENMNNPLTRKHLSESTMGHTHQRGEKNSMYGKHHSEEARKKQSEKAKERTGEKNGMYGKHHSEEARKKQSEKAKLRKPTTLGMHWTLSDESKQNIRNGINKRYENMTQDERKILSENMSGEKNPCYGRKWMTNGINKVYPKPEEFQKYLNEGYHFGMK